MRYTATGKGGAVYHAAAPFEGVDESELIDWLAPELYVGDQRLTAWTPNTMHILAVVCAEHVLPFFEALYQDDLPRLAIEGGKRGIARKAAIGAREAAAIASADAQSWQDRVRENFGAAISGRNQEPGYVSIAEQVAVYTAAALAAKAAALAATTRSVVELRPCLIACQQAAGNAAQVGIPWVNVAPPEPGRYGPPTRVILWPDNRGQRERDAKATERAWQNARLLELL